MEIERGTRARQAAVVGVLVVSGVLGVSLALFGAAPSGAAASAGVHAELVVDSTTTTTVPTTTTTIPPTTTTIPPTTTTSTAPTTTTTTTTHPVRTTTTTAPATTTTTTPSKATSSKTPWGLIVLIIVLVIAIVLVAVLIRSRRKRGAERQWHRAVVPALSDAQLARESLLSGNALSDDPQLRGAVEVQVEKAATALERAASSAPDPQAGSLATAAAAALRGLAFAIEADRLLRHGASAPSGVQLAQADDARRARSGELSTALARLSTRIGSTPAASGRH
jgi:hypothetical protein